MKNYRLAINCKICLLVIFLLLDAGNNGSVAQTMHFQLLVEDEFAILDPSHIEMVGLSPAHGTVYINHSDTSAGSFFVTAAENIHLLLSYEAPEALVLDSHNSIPVSIRAAYHNDTHTNESAATPFNGNTVFFPISRSGMLVEQMDVTRHRLRASLFFYGEMHVGDVDPGLYTGIVTVRVEYQ